MTTFKAAFHGIEVDGNGKVTFTTEVNNEKYTADFSVEQLEEIVVAAKAHRDEYRESLESKKKAVRTNSLKRKSRTTKALRQ